MSIESFISYLSLEKNYSPHTTKAYHNDIVEFENFRSWIVSLVESGVSNRSVNRKIASLKAYYKFLLGVGILTINPLSKHKALKTSKKIEIPFSETEMEDVLSQIPFENNFEGKRNKLIIELLYTTGIRRAELIGLKVKDVDYQAMTIKVLGKRNKERIIPLLGATKELFLEYNLERSTLSVIQDEAYIFLTDKGNKMYETLVYRIIPIIVLRN